MKMGRAVVMWMPLHELNIKTALFGGIAGNEKRGRGAIRVFLPLNVLQVHETCDRRIDVGPHSTKPYERPRNQCNQRQPPQRRNTSHAYLLIEIVLLSSVQYHARTKNSPRMHSDHAYQAPRSVGDLHATS